MTLRTAQRKVLQNSEVACSFLFSLALSGVGFRCGRSGLGEQDADRAIAIDEGLVRNSLHVGWSDFVYAIDLAEEFAPVTEARLHGCQILRETLVVIEAAYQAGLGAGLDHLEFVGADVLSLESRNLGLDSSLQFLGLMAGRGNSVKRKQVRVLAAGQSTKSSRAGSNLLVANEGAIEA